MSGRRARSAVEVNHRSIYPSIPGVPWWAALLIAVAATAIGYAIDAGSGHKELTHVFAGFYIAGCLAAVLAVRQEGVFTAIIQPPLILFCAVPGAYWLFHGGKMNHLKDLLINCGYPLIERFPLMLGTAGGVLLIGLLRWYFGMSQRNTTAVNPPDDAATATSAGGPSFVAGIVAKLQSILHPDSGEEAADDAASAAPRRNRSARPSTARSEARSEARRTARSGRTATGTSRARSRHPREPLDGTQESVAERPRRSSRRSPASARDYDTGEAPRRSRRRPAPQDESDPRDQPREGRREPRARRSPHERPSPRSSRFDGLERYGDRYDPPASPERFSRYDAHDRYESYEPRRRRSTTNGANPTHHPISQVRYRDGAPGDDYPAEPGGGRRSRSGTSRRPAAESWEYDG